MLLGDSGYMQLSQTVGVYNGICMNPLHWLLVRYTNLGFQDKKASI